MLNLITILESLKAKPRPLTVEEDLYLEYLNQEIKKAESDAGRWRLLEREGLGQIEIEKYGFDPDLLEHLFKLRRKSMN